MLNTCSWLSALAFICQLRFGNAHLQGVFCFAPQMSPWCVLPNLLWTRWAVLHGDLISKTLRPPNQPPPSQSPRQRGPQPRKCSHGNIATEKWPQPPSPQPLRFQITKKKNPSLITSIPVETFIFFKNTATHEKQLFRIVLCDQQASSLPAHVL